MASNHEGYDIGIHVDTNELEKSNQLVSAFNDFLAKADSKLSGLHIASGLTDSMKGLNSATSDYVGKLKSSSDAYESNKQAIKSYQTALSDLTDKQILLKSELFKIAEASDKTSSDYQIQQAKIKNVSSEISLYNSKIKAARNAMLDLYMPSKKVADATNKQADAANNAKSAVDKQADSAVSAAAKESGLRIKTDETTSAFGKLHSAGSKIAGMATSVAIAMAPVGLAFKRAADQATDLQNKYLTIKNLMETGGDSAGLAKREQRIMERRNRELSDEYGVSQQSLAEGSEHLIRRGYSGKQEIASHPYFLQAAMASGNSYNDVVNYGAPVLEGFGYKTKAGNSRKKMAEYTKRVLNQMAYVSDLSATDFSGIGNAMRMVSQTAHSNKISMAGTLAALGVESNNGLDGTIAGTGLRKDINSLVSPIMKGQQGQALKNMGLTQQSFLQNGHLESIPRIFETLNRATRNETSAQQSANFHKLFGTAGQESALVLAKNYRQIGRLSDKADEASSYNHGKGYIDTLSRKNMASFNNQYKIFKTNLSNVMTDVAKDLMPTMAHMLKSVNGVLEAFKKLPAPMKKGIGLSAAGLGMAGSAYVGSHILKTSLKLIGIGGGVKAAAGGSIAKRLSESFIGRRAASLGPTLFGASKEIFVKPNPNRIGLIGRIRGTKGALISAGGSIKSRASSIVGAGKSLATKTAELGQGALTASRGMSFSKAWGLGKNLIGRIPRLNLSGALSSANSVGGFKNLSSLGKVTNGAAGIGIAMSSATDLFGAITAKNKSSRYKKLGSGLGKAILGGIGLVFGGPIGAAVGTSIGGVIGKWFGSNNKYTRTIKRTFGQTLHSVVENVKPIGRMVGSTVKSISSSIHSVPRTLSRDWATINKNRDFISFKKFFKSGLMATVRFSIKEIGTTLNFGINIFKDVFRIVGTLLKSTVGVVGNSVKLVADLISGHWSSAWKDCGNIVDNVVGGIVGTLKGLWKMVSHVFGWIGGTVKNVWNFITGKDNKTYKKPATDPSVHSAMSTVHRMDNPEKAKAYRVHRRPNIAVRSNYQLSHLKEHAAGGDITSTHMALVGEQGPELKYRKYGTNARLIGANGPEITKVRSGDHILNARDTNRVLHGGLGAGLMLRGYASGTDKLSKQTTTDYKTISDKSAKSLQTFAKTSTSVWNKVHSNTAKNTKSIKTGSIADFTGMRNSVTKTNNNLSRDTMSTVTGMTKGMIKQSDLMQDGVVGNAKDMATGFGNAIGKLRGYARSAMSDTVDQLNKGIGGIDKVLDQFGGNSQVIKPVRFAAGTNGKLPHDTLAMVNDATSGPRQEAVLRGNNMYLPRGDNRVMPLKKGDQVLNGYQLNQVARNWGLSHFAKGSGVSKSALRKIIERGLSKPKASFQQMFTSNLHDPHTDIAKDTTELAKRSTSQLGNSWMGAIWQALSDAMGGAAGKGGSREAFLKYAESNFTGVPYQMGAMSRNLADCSGMVAMALRHFGLSIGRTTTAMQSSSGTQYLGKSLSKTIPGDLAIFGHGDGAAGHVGIIKNPETGTMFNETPPRATVSSIANDEGMGYGFYRVNGLRNGSDKKAKHSNSLLALAKKELGKSALSWVKKNLSEDLDVGSFNIGGDVGTRARILAKALESADPRATKSGIAAILGNWEFESGLNPSATNPGGGASGLGQWLGGRLANLKAYARRKGKSWTSPAAQLEFALRGDGSDSSVLRRILESNGSVESLASQFSTEWERGGYTGQHVAGARTIRKALGYAKGGTPRVGNTVVVGEHGPELAKFEQPVHVYSNDDSKKIDFGKLLGKSKHHARPQKSAPTINININGNISSEKTAAKYAEIIEQKLNAIFNNIGDEFGGDPSVY